MSNIAEFYDEFSTHQSEVGINHRHLSIQRYLEKFGLQKHHHVLELGCGIGTQTELLLQYLASDAKVLANDISPKSINKAQKRLSKYDNVEFITGDITKLDIKGNFDIILLPDVLEHIPIATHSQLFKKIDLHLKEGGSVIIHIPNPYFLHWLGKNRPEELQIIDQPIYTNILLESISETDLYLHYLKTYSIYNSPEDYQIIVLKKRRFQEFFPAGQPPMDSVFRRIKRKLIYILRGNK